MRRPGSGCGQGLLTGFLSTEERIHPTGRAVAQAGLLAPGPPCRSKVCRTHSRSFLHASPCLDFGSQASLGNLLVTKLASLSLES